MDTYVGVVYPTPGTHSAANLIGVRRWANGDHSSVLGDLNCSMLVEPSDNIFRKRIPSPGSCFMLFLSYHCYRMRLGRHTLSNQKSWPDFLSMGLKYGEDCSNNAHRQQ